MATNGTNWYQNYNSAQSAAQAQPTAQMQAWAANPSTQPWTNQRYTGQTRAAQPGMMFAQGAPQQYAGQQQQMSAWGNPTANPYTAQSVLPAGYSNQVPTTGYNNYDQPAYNPGGGASVLPANAAYQPPYPSQTELPRFVLPNTVNGTPWDQNVWTGYNPNQLAGAQAMNTQMQGWAGLAAQTQQAQAELKQHQNEFNITQPWQQQTDTWANQLGNKQSDITQQANQWANELGNRQQAAVEQQNQWNQGWLPQQQANQIRADAQNMATQTWGRTQRPNTRYV